MQLWAPGIVTPGHQIYCNNNIVEGGQIKCFERGLAVSAASKYGTLKTLLPRLCACCLLPPQAELVLLFCLKISLRMFVFQICHVLHLQPAAFEIMQE